MTPPRKARSNVIGLLAATLALGAGAATPAQATANPVTQSAPAPVREFVAPQKEKRAKKKKAKVKYTHGDATTIRTRTPACRHFEAES